MTNILERERHGFETVSRKQQGFSKHSSVGAFLGISVSNIQIPLMSTEMTDGRRDKGSVAINILVSVRGSGGYF